MPGGKEAFERKLDELAALRAASSAENAVEPLQKALKDRSNYLVSKAAALFNGSAYFALKKLISIAGDLCEQRIFIVEMTIRRSNRDTGEPRGFVQ